MLNVGKGIETHANSIMNGVNISTHMSSCEMNKNMLDWLNYVTLCCLQLDKSSLQMQTTAEQPKVLSQD